MKKTLALLALTTALTIPALASARPVTFNVDLARYAGDDAYLVVYVTDPAGRYAGSLWMAGKKSKYYDDLSNWYRITGGNKSEVNGITGASVGSGNTLEVSFDLQDAIFDAGYTLHVDVAVEDMRSSPREVSLPLTAQGASADGSRYLRTASYR